MTLCAAAAAASFGGMRWAANATGSTARETDAVRASTHKLLIVDALKRRWPRATPVHDAGKPCRVRFASSDGGRVVGVVAAVVFPLADDRPVVAGGREVHMLQSDDGELDLHVWRKRVPPRGRSVLRYSVRVERDSRTTFESGWAEIDDVSLAVGCVEVRLPGGPSVDVQVETRAGAPVPGALVLVESRGLAPGLTSAIVITDRDGRATLSGVDDEDCFATIVTGVGPSKEAVEAPIVGKPRRARLVLPLDGDWAFDAIQVGRAMAGRAVVISHVRGTAGEELTVWPVTSIVPPGGRLATAWLMRPAGTSRPDAVAIEVLGRGILRARADALGFALDVDAPARRATEGPGPR
jgi:hypothetical protein